MSGDISFEIPKLKQRLARLGQFATKFQDDGFVFAEMQGGSEIEPGVYQMPWSSLRETANQFYQQCYDDGWVVPGFDWMEWIQKPEARGLLCDPDNPSPGANLSKASPEQLAMLLTAVIRNDRGCEGFLEGAYSSGLLTSIVRRAEELAQSLDDSETSRPSEIPDSVLDRLGKATPGSPIAHKMKTSLVKDIPMATVAPTQEPEFENLPLRLAYTFLDASALANEAAEIRTSPERLGSYISSLKRAKVVALLRRNDLLDRFIETSWHFALTPAGKRKLHRYDQIYSRYEKSGGIVSSPNALTEDETEAGTKFALEEQLRDYLAENLGILEPSLSLWPVENGDAVEFQVDEQGPTRRIDILAKDHDGLPVVIELKVSRGHERTIGQALYYRARIKRRFGAERVRIFIVAAEISPPLRAAASEVSDLLLFEYSLAVKVTAITI